MRQWKLVVGPHCVVPDWHGVQVLLPVVPVELVEVLLVEVLLVAVLPVELLLVEVLLVEVVPHLQKPVEVSQVTAPQSAFEVQPMAPATSQKPLGSQ